MAQYVRYSVLVTVMVYVLTGCTSTRGPAFVVESHVAYNKAVSQVLSEELLLNIVRRRYLEAPQFLSVDSISARIDVQQDLGISGSYDISGGSDSGPSFSLGAASGLTLSGTSVGSSDWSPVGFNAGISFTDSPTITLTPRQGEDIAGPLHAPMDAGILAELANVGYRFDLLLLLLVQDINGVRNVDAGVGESFRGGSREFVELVQLVRALTLRDELVLGSFKYEDNYNIEPIPAAQITPEHWLTAVATEARWRSHDDGEHYFLTDSKLYPAVWMPPAVKASPEGRRVLELLNLEAEPRHAVWPIKSSKTVAGPDLTTHPNTPRSSLAARLRSFYGVMNLLSYGVELPADEDGQTGTFAAETYDNAVEEGRFEDLRNAFRIHAQRTKPVMGIATSIPLVPDDDGPGAAFIAVPYRGHWYYIDDADLVSKRVFNAIYDLFHLQVANSGGGNAPVLTLPVN